MLVSLWRNCLGLAMCSGAYSFFRFIGVFCALEIFPIVEITMMSVSTDLFPDNFLQN